MTLIVNKKIVIALALVLFLGLFAAVANANNSWSKYHWDKSTTDSPLVLGSNLTTSAWMSSLSGASSDWNVSVLKNQVVNGSNANCDPVLGQVEVCNAEYGDTNWLGIAQVWVYRGRDGHIAQALVKMNDTYFNTDTYNTSAWRNLVVCQEVGHTYGLSHQDEDFDNANLNTCMDYTSNPDSNQHPNQHDYNELADKYAHLNGTSGGDGDGDGGKPDKCSPWPSCKKNAGADKVGVGADIDLNDPSAWGQVVRFDARGNTSLFERNLGNGQVLLTYVIWVD